MASSEVVRPLGLIETYSTSRHALGVYRGIALACQYAVPASLVESGSLETAVEQALARTVLRLPSLRVGIKDEASNKPSFVSVPALDLQEAIEWSTVSAADLPELDAVILKLLEDRLVPLWEDVSTRPPWKLIVVCNTQQEVGASPLNIIFRTHHALCDGKSTAVFQSVLLDELNSESGAPAELEDHILRFRDVPVLVPSQEELVKFRISWPYFLKTLWHHFAPAWLRGTPSVIPWTGKPVSLEPHKLHLRIAEIPADLVPDLLAACRSHDATLTALLHILTLASLSRRLSAKVAPAFVSNTAVSTQPYATVPEGLKLSETMTDMNTAVTHKFDPDVVSELRAHLEGSGSSDVETYIWGLTTKLRANLKEELSKITTDNIAGLLAWVSDWRKYLLEQIGKPRDSSWAVSNIGSMSISKAGSGEDKAGRWRILKTIFTQPVAVIAPAFALNVSGVERGPITIVLNFQEGIVADQVMDGITEDLRVWLANFQQTRSFSMISKKE